MGGTWSEGKMSGSGEGLRRVWFGTAIVIWRVCCFWIGVVLVYCLVGVGVGGSGRLFVRAL